MKRDKIIQIRVNDVLKEKVEDMAEFYSQSQSAIVRTAINEKYDDYVKQAYGYQTGALQAKRRQKKDEQSDEQRALSKKITTLAEEEKYDELSAYLREIGYSPQPEVDDNGLVGHERFINFPEYGGPGYYRFKHDPKTNQIRDRVYVFSLEQLINDVLNNI